MKTPVAKRKIKGSKAPKTSPLLSGLTLNRWGSGALKLGGGANDEGEASDWVLTEVEVEEVSDMALMHTLFLGFLGNERGIQTENWDRLNAPAIAMASGKLNSEQALVYKADVCVFVAQPKWGLFGWSL